MSEIVRILFLTIIFTSSLVFQMNLDADNTTTRDLKRYGELAAHDAALALDETSLADGNRVFDEDQGETYLMQSLQQHFELNTDLEPTADSFLQAPLEVVHLQYIDEETDDSVCNQNNADGVVSFPCTYSASDYYFNEMLDGPGIVVILETESPRYFNGDPLVVRQGAVYDYE